jgi:hypothetical protein
MMNLEDIYQNNVKSKKLTLFSTPFETPSIERDPVIMNLEKNVFEQLQKIIPKEETQQLTKSLTVRTVSYEEALKELLEISKK